jgi:hypothetical protein
MMSCRGLCLSHGANTMIDNYPGSGCTNKIRRDEVFARHGNRRWAVRKSCSHHTRVMQKTSPNKSVCVKYGAKMRCCNHEGCTNQVVKGGVCRGQWPPQVAGR